MSRVVLARKWRPKSFGQVIGQPSIVKSLQNRLHMGEMPQALLFAGPHGVGKTTLARVAAMSLRCVKINLEQINPDPCGECGECISIQQDSCMDVLEVDGASFNSVDDIREILEGLPYLPSSGNSKIIIIDEVHMLSKGAFNALLKTLESPAKHVYFIFATTHPDKIPLTILSRLFRFDLSTISRHGMIEHLQMICSDEDIHIESIQVLEKITLRAAGHLRDALNYLDQIIGLSPSSRSGKIMISVEMANQALGLVQEEKLEHFVKLILAADTSGVSSNFHDLMQAQSDIQSLVYSIFDFIYKLITHPESYNLIQKEIPDLSMEELFWLYEGLVQDFSWAITSLVPEKTLEIILLKYTMRRSFFMGMPSKTQSHVSVDSKEKVEVKPLPSWQEFLDHLKENSPKLCFNLEQGNLWDKMLRIENDDLYISYAMIPKSKMFGHFLRSESGQESLLKELSEFYNIAKERIHFSLVDLNEEEIKRTHFLTIVEKNEEDKKNKVEEIKNNFINDEGVLALQKVFNTKIDKIVLKD